MAAEMPATSPVRHRPRQTTVFVAAFVAGAAAAVGVNRALDVHLAQSKPQVECEPIFVALRSLPQGVPVTIWDVALRDWPKAMLPTSALRVTDSFAGCVLKYPLREGQPLLAVQLLAPPPVPVQVDPPQGEHKETIVEEAFVVPQPAAEAVVAVPQAIPPPPPATIDAAGPDVAVATTETAANGDEATLAPRPEAASESSTDDVAETDPTSDPTSDVTTDLTADLAPADGDARAANPFDDPPPPQPPVAGQPTPATPKADIGSSDASEPTPASPVAGSPSAGDAGVATFDMPSRLPVDAAKIPSVVAHGTATAAPADERAGSGPNVRYLVVPERIAQQADTSFTTPVAPEARPTGVAPGPSASAPPAARSQRSAAAPASRQNQAPQARQARQPQPARKQSTSSRPQRQRPQPQPVAKPAQGEQQANPRAWGGMFPNVSAGLDALGSWRGRARESELTGQRADDQQQPPPR